MHKAEARAWIRQKKQAMTEEEIQSESSRLGVLLRENPLYRSARSVYGYLPCNQEVRLVPLLEQALRDGKRVAVPKVFGREMKFIWMEDLSRVKPGFAKIPEPVDDGPEADDPTALVLMPGLAFDKFGSRVGYGGGFYDRFLQREPEHPTLALCYGFQLVDHLETEAFDRKVDCVLPSDAKKENEK